MPRSFDAERIVEKVLDTCGAIVEHCIDLIRSQPNFAAITIIASDFLTNLPDERRTMKQSQNSVEQLHSTP